MLDRSGFNFILNTPGRCGRCRDAPLWTPVRLEIVCRTDPSLEALANSLGDAILIELGLVSEVELCGGPRGIGCLGYRDPDTDNLLVVLCDGTADDGAVDHLVDEYLADGYRVVGLLPRWSHPSVSLPGRLRSRVALFYDAGPEELVPDLVAIAGCGGADRRVFISYAHSDGQHAAGLVFDELTRRQFDCYLDRFRTLPGDDFVERIDDELADKAMVVVIETAGSVASTWVLFEVLTARARGYGLVAVNVDGEPEHPLIPESLRCRVKRLDDEGVADAYRFVQSAHRLAIAQLQRSRAQDILSSLALYAPSAMVTGQHDGAEVVAAGVSYRVTGSVRPVGVRETRLALAALPQPSMRPFVYSPIYAESRRRLDQQFLDDETPTGIIPDGLLRTAAELMDRGAL